MVLLKKYLTNDHNNLPTALELKAIKWNFVKPLASHKETFTLL